eukprot:3080221-Amphidinium_carterae.1
MEMRGLAGEDEGYWCHASRQDGQGGLADIMYETQTVRSCHINVTRLRQLKREQGLGSFARALGMKHCDCQLCMACKRRNLTLAMLPVRM